MSKQWTSRLLVLSIIFLVTAGLVVVGVWYRLEKVESGVCEKAGRVLTEEELRRAVLQSLVDLEVDRTNILYRHDRNLSAGIISNLEFTDFIKLMEKAVQSDTGMFEENFGLKKIAPKKGPFDISSLQEPFILMEDHLKADGVAGFYVSSHVQKASYNGRLSLGKRLFGYGKYYFHIPFFTFIAKCCGKRFSREERADAYEFSYDSRAINPKEVVPVSNCGDLLTEREQDTGLYLSQPVFLKGE
jgi:hypothetical protein